MDRTRNAYFLLKNLKKTTQTLYTSWHSIIMHLPYAFQARRMLSEIYILDNVNKNFTGNEKPEEFQNLLKETSKSESYKAFVDSKLQPAELLNAIR